MKYTDVEFLVSQPRLDRYLVACQNSKTKAQKLYKANLRLSQAIYPVLNLFEVILRNSIHYNLSAHFTNPNWIVREKNGFMSDPSLRSSRFYLKEQVQKAERKLRRRRSTITAGKVIAEQSFGFWTSLFDPHHYRLVGGSIIHCFPNKLPHVNRRIISSKMQVVREFRNRIYHNEPICFNSNIIDLSDAEGFKSDIYDLLTWISPEAKAFTEGYDSIDSKIEIAKRI